MRKGLLMFLVAVLVIGVFALIGRGVLAGGDEVPVKPERGKPVRPGVSLWVFVFPENPGQGPKEPPKKDDSYDKCTDGNQLDYSLFAKAKQDGMTFNIADGTIPDYLLKDDAIKALVDSFRAWDDVLDGDSDTWTYFTVNTTGGASRPGEDGNNSVGWAFLVPPTVLAAAWVWVDDDTGRVKEADIFFNNQHDWGVFLVCDEQTAYEVGNVGTHEVGHVLALDHVKDEGGHATMYPSAPKGEVKKRTLTDGDAEGFRAALQ